MKSLANKIRNLRISLKLTRKELGARIGVNQTTAQRWERGAVPSFNHTEKLAALAGETVEEFMDLGGSGESRSTGRRIPVIGAVHASEWTESPEWPDEERYEISVPLPAQWWDVPVHGLAVRGDSFNKVLPSGTIVVVAPVKYLPRALKSGDIVVAMRRDEGGDYETTLKEYVVTPDGEKWLWPRSTSPEYQAPVQFNGGAKRTAEVRVVGMVIFSLLDMMALTDKN